MVLLHYTDLSVAAHAGLAEMSFHQRLTFGCLSKTARARSLLTTPAYHF